MTPSFDPNDPFDVVSEKFRQKVCDVACEMLDDPSYCSLAPTQQLEAFMAGALVGIIGICFAHILPQGRDDMMRSIVGYLPQAREQAEAIDEQANRQVQ